MWSARHIFICCGCFVFSGAYIREALHDVMNEAELAYYFQTDDRDMIPDYEIVDLPMVLPVSDAKDLLGGDPEEIQYRFSVFDR